MGLVSTKWLANRDTTGRIVGETIPGGDVLAGTFTPGDRDAAYDRARRLTEVKDSTAASGKTAIP